MEVAKVGESFTLGELHQGARVYLPPKLLVSSNNEVLEEEVGGSGKCFVTVTYAQSLDGCLTAVPGQQTQISGPLSSRFTHMLRATYQAIMVGISTVISDNPRLTTRLTSDSQENFSSPIPVVIDSKLRIPLYCRLLDKDAPHSPIIFCGVDASKERKEQLIKMGATVIPINYCKNAEGRLLMEEIFEKLYSNGIKSVMVEGGATIIESVLNTDLVDSVIVTISSHYFGATSHVVQRTPRISSLHNVMYRRLGDDIVLFGIPSQKSI